MCCCTAMRKGRIAGRGSRQGGSARLGLGPGPRIRQLAERGQEKGGCRLATVSVLRVSTLHIRPHTCTRQCSCLRFDLRTLLQILGAYLACARATKPGGRPKPRRITGYRGSDEWNCPGRTATLASPPPPSNANCCWLVRWDGDSITSLDAWRQHQCTPSATRYLACSPGPWQLAPQNQLQPLPDDNASARTLVAQRHFWSTWCPRLVTLRRKLRPRSTRPRIPRQHRPTPLQVR